MILHILSQSFSQIMSFSRLSHLLFKESVFPFCLQHSLFLHNIIEIFILLQCNINEIFFLLRLNSNQLTWDSLLYNRHNCLSLVEAWTSRGTVPSHGWRGWRWWWWGRWWLSTASARMSSGCEPYSQWAWYKHW